MMIEVECYVGTSKGGGNFVWRRAGPLGRASSRKMAEFHLDFTCEFSCPSRRAESSMTASLEGQRF